MECIWIIVGTAAVSLVATLGPIWFSLSNDRALRLKPTMAVQEFYRSYLALGLDPWDTSSIDSSMQQARLPR